MAEFDFNSWKPKLADSIVMIERDDAFCFFRPEVPDWVVGNRNVAAVLSRCNGALGAGEIAALVNREHGGIKESEVLDMLGTMRSEHFLFSDQPFETVPFHPYRLNSIHLNLTDACNLDCVYCYARGRGPETGRLKLAEYKEFLEEIAPYGPLMITLTGGEPTLNPDWLPIARRTRDLGHSVMLLTNATRLSGKEAAEAAEIFNPIKISIDGGSEAVHDALRGKGSFAAAMSTVEELLARGARVILSMTVTRANIGDIPAAAARYGKLLSFSPLFRAGAARLRPDLDITGDEYYQALVSAPGVNPLSTLCDVLGSAAGKPIRKCSIGDGEISISPDGTVYPCHMLHYPEFSAGNIRTGRIDEILRSAAMMRCQDLVVDNLADCRDCEVRYLCGGACRARAFHATGRIDAADDFCSYEYRAFMEGILRVYRCS